MELFELIKEAETGLASLRNRGQRTPEYETRLIEAANLLANTRGWNSAMHQAILREAFSTEDFPTLMGDILDRQMLAYYRQAPDQVDGVYTTLKPIFTAKSLKDFRGAKAYRLDGGKSMLMEVGPMGEYLRADSMSETSYTFGLRKWGKAFDMTWEMLLNDDYGAFLDFPQRLANSAIWTEEIQRICTFFGATGPLASYFATANGGAAVSNLPLTIENLETAIKAMAAYTAPDLTAVPLFNRPRYLVVAPALEMTARKILAATLIQTVMPTGGGDTGAATYKMVPTQSIIPTYNLKLIVPQFLPYIVTSGTVGSTCWALFADPSAVPAATFNRLRGYDTPELFVKNSNQSRVNGGATSPLDGDFEHDAVQYKVRDVFDTTTLDGRAGGASNGQ